MKGSGHSALSRDEMSFAIMRLRTMCHCH
ncbi:unnamed protein product, partial [Allacma fusca]